MFSLSDRFSFDNNDNFNNLLKSLQNWVWDLKLLSNIIIFEYCHLSTPCKPSTNLNRQSRFATKTNHMIIAYRIFINIPPLHLFLYTVQYWYEHYFTKLSRFIESINDRLRLGYPRYARFRKRILSTERIRACFCFRTSVSLGNARSPFIFCPSFSFSAPRAMRILAISERPGKLRLH